MQVEWRVALRTRQEASHAASTHPGRGAGRWHAKSCIIERRQILGDVEKQRLYKLMRELAAFGGLDTLLRRRSCTPATIISTHASNRSRGNWLTRQFFWSLAPLDQMDFARVVPVRQAQGALPPLLLAHGSIYWYHIGGLNPMSSRPCWAHPANPAYAANRTADLDRSRTGIE
jgi:hypothetical protein